MKHISKLLLLIIVGMIFTSCYKDNEEELYPEVITCNIDSISFSQSIVPILQINCYGCHSNSAAGVAGAGISFEGYSNVAGYLNNNSELFINSISHEPGVSPMPKGGAKLPECAINQIKSWIDDTYPNN